MEIAFSQAAVDRALRGTQYRKDSQPETQTVLAGWVAYVARDHGATLEPTSWNGWRYRFTLPGASNAKHETVIAALLDLDPDAAIRTSRAVYRGRAEYRRQKGLAVVASSERPVEFRPFCDKCGWRKGGTDSWNGVACKCGETAPPIQKVIHSPT